MESNTQALNAEQQRQRQQAALALLAQGRMRARDAALTSGLTECELVAGRCGSSATRLQPQWRALFSRLVELDRVMALTRNDHAVHERHGRYDEVHINGSTGLVLNPEIDLRLFFRQWAYGFAVSESSGGRTRRSLQFFAPDGTAVHKIYLTGASDEAAYERLVEDFRDDDQGCYQALKPPAPPAAETPDASIDIAGFHAAWRALTDTHQFHGMLKRFKLGRLQALRLAEAEFARRVSQDSARRLLQTAAAAASPIMVFVANAGTVQIHTGPVKNLRPTGPWFNVLDPDFNLHLREDAIAHCYVVGKPTDDGIVTSLEVFDHSGSLIVQLFGARKPGQPEREDWRAIISTLEKAA